MKGVPESFFSSEFSITIKPILKDEGLLPRADWNEEKCCWEDSPYNVPELPAVYPEPSNWGILPAYGLYARHIDGLKLDEYEEPLPGEKIEEGTSNMEIVIKFFNAETAKAAKGSYKLTRTGKFIKAIDVGNATSALNSIIQGVDENASLDSVVGGFLGIKKDPITAEVKNGKGEGFDGKYMIKAMTLTEADVKDFAVNGNKYSIQINACTNPGANSAIAHATNDYITFAEVNQSIANEVGSAVKVVEGESQATYNKIVFTATVVDGKITALDYSYTFGATLKIKLAIMNATGTGEAEIIGKYTNVKY